MRSTDMGAPDITGARERFPAWRFGRDGKWWTAEHREGKALPQRGRSPESLEGKVARAERELRAPGVGRSDTYRGKITDC